MKKKARDISFVAMILSAPHLFDSSTGVFIFLSGIALLAWSYDKEG